MEDLNDPPGEASCPVGASPFASGLTISRKTRKMQRRPQKLHKPVELAVPSGLPPPPVHAATVAPRTEDALRRQKRISLPVVATHPTPGTTKSNVTGKDASKRRPLVLGNLKTNSSKSQSRSVQGVAVGKWSELPDEEAMPKIDWVDTCHAKVMD